MNIELLGVPMDLGSGRRGVDMGPGAPDRRLESAAAGAGHRVIDGATSNQQHGGAPVGKLHARYLAEIARATGVEQGSSGHRAAPLSAGPRRRPFDRDRHRFPASPPSAAQEKKARAALGRRPQRHPRPEDLPSGNIHGMPLAALFGLGPRSSARSAGGIETRSGACRAGGIRSLDEGNGRTWRELGIRVYTMSDIDRDGIHAVMSDALARVTDGTDCCT